VRSELVDAVAAQGLAAPSPIQQLAIPRLLAGASVAMASSTGSGKTLAYLVPMMQRLKEQEDARPEHKAELRPRALVLAPTRDLVEQIAAQAKALSHVCRVRVRALAAGGRLRDQRKSLRTGADLIVATPGRLLTLHKLGDVSLRSVESVTVDEADDVLLRGFDEELDAILRRCSPPRRRAGDEGEADEAGGAGGRAGRVQVALASATLSAEARHAIGKGFPRAELLFTPCAHRAPPSLTHRLLHVEGDKMEVLAQRVKQLGADTPALIFCRGIQSARAVGKSLSDAGLSVAGCHGGMPPDARAEARAAFSDGRQSVLVATDLAARGLHFPRVKLVINFDFPASSALYLHRAGRTARFGATGEVVSLITPRQRRHAEALQAALSKKAQIHAVDYSGRLTTTTLSHFDERPKQARRSASRPRGGGGRRLGLAAL